MGRSRMMSLTEAAWVIARRDFVATVYSRSFVLFLLAPVLLLSFFFFFGEMAEEAERAASQPVVAVVADSETVEQLEAARRRLVEGTSSQSFPILRQVAPAENVSVQAGRLLAEEAEGYSAVLSGTLDRPVVTGPARVDAGLASRLQLIVDQARRTSALESAGVAVRASPVERVVTEQAAGSLQMLRRKLAGVGQGLIFMVTLMLATLLLSNLVEEKSNKVIEVLAASIPLDSVFLGKLIAMLGISSVGLILWGGMLGLGYLFVQVIQDWMVVPDVSPAVGWPAFVLLMLIYYGTNFMLLGSLFLGIGGQASNIREIQTVSMPVTLLQLGVFLIAMTAAGSQDGMLVWFGYVFPFSSPMTMIAYAAQHETLWPHLLALAWQALWVVLIIRISSRLFRRTVLKSSPSGAFFDFSRWRRRGTPAQ